MSERPDGVFILTPSPSHPLPTTSMLSKAVQGHPAMQVDGLAS